MTTLGDAVHEIDSLLFELRCTVYRALGAGLALDISMNPPDVVHGFGFVRDSRGFWLAPSSALATKVKHDNHDIDDNEEEAKP